MARDSQQIQQRSSARVSDSPFHANGATGHERGTLQRGGMGSCAVSNTDQILSALDEKLDNPVELTLYGRAALFLGFEDAPREFGQSRDVDGVLWKGQTEELIRNTNFWEAVAELNEQFREQELYITHFFEEQQLILTPHWRENR